MRGNQTTFQPDWVCVDQIFLVRQILEHGDTFCRPKIHVFLALKAAFDSVNRSILWRCITEECAIEIRLTFPVSVGAIEAEFVFMAIFRPSSPQLVVFVTFSFQLPK